MKKKQRYLTQSEADFLGIELKENLAGTDKGRYSITDANFEAVKKNRSGAKRAEVSTTSETLPNDYEDEPFFLSAYCKETKSILGIKEFCKKYNQPFENVSSYKFLPYHYKEPSYNIVFKESIVSAEVIQDFDFDSIIKKYVEKVPQQKVEHEATADYDFLTYSDVHIGMETNADNNSMYAEIWDRQNVLKSAELMIKETLSNKKSNILIIDDLADLLDGFNGETTRGGHHLPQNMTNEQCFDLGLEFKMTIAEGLIGHYDEILINNICNDNHAGAFGYFVNSAFKSLIQSKYENVKVTNHRKFINHYYIGRVAFVITHGKDDKALKFGFKPQLDSKGLEKIDQYCKQYDIYRNSDLVVFKKGDSHQCLFDMATSDDFFYFNYPALSPSSNWVQSNFKKGRRGFVNESLTGLTITQKVNFIK